MTVSRLIVHNAMKEPLPQSSLPHTIKPAVQRFSASRDSHQPRLSIPPGLYTYRDHPGDILSVKLSRCAPQRISYSGSFSGKTKRIHLMPVLLCIWRCRRRLKTMSLSGHQMAIYLTKSTAIDIILTTKFMFAAGYFFFLWNARMRFIQRRQWIDKHAYDAYWCSWYTCRGWGDWR